MPSKKENKTVKKWSMTELKEERNNFRKLAMCYCKGNYSVNVLVCGLIEEELGFEKYEPKKMFQFFLLHVNS